MLSKFKQTTEKLVVRGCKLNQRIPGKGLGLLEIGPNAFFGERSKTIFLNEKKKKNMKTELQFGNGTLSITS